MRFLTLWRELGVGYLTDQVPSGRLLSGRIWTWCGLQAERVDVLEVEFTRLSFHQQFTTTGGSWSSGGLESFHGHCFCALLTLAEGLAAGVGHQVNHLLVVTDVE